MAHTPHKVKQAALFTQTACVSGILTVDGGVVAGSTMTFAKGIVASSTLDVAKTITCSSILNVTGGIVASSTVTVAGSVTFSAKVTAASDFNTSGCVQIGATGTDIFHILAGSVAASTPAISASGTGTASATITGLTTAHKIFISPSAMSGSLFIYEVYCSGACPAVLINLLAAENVAEDTGAKFSYLAIREA